MQRILKIQFLVSATILLCSGIEASAAGICADIAIFNKTSTQFTITGSVDGAWSSFFGPPPTTTVGPNQTINFGSCSNGGVLPTGTGGTANFSPSTGTIHWSAPWFVDNGGLANCSSSIDPPQGFFVFSIAGGIVSQGRGGPGGEWGCLNEFTITAIINEKSLRSFQSTSSNNADWISVLGADRNLWLERAPFGNVPPNRQLIDSNVLTFQTLDNQTALVLGLDGRFWKERSPFGVLAIDRTLIDQNVKSFQALDSETFLVLGSDGKLWLENSQNGNAASNRKQVDGGVDAFQGLDGQTVLVLGNDGNLWLERAPFGNVPPSRVQIDTNVRRFEGFSFGANSLSVLFVLGNDGNLWQEFDPFGHVPPSRVQIDTNVDSFQGFPSITGNETVLVRGTDGNLWLEQKPFGNIPPARKFVDRDVAAFQGINDGNQTIIVLGTDGKLWLERAPFGAFPPARTQIDSNVL